MQVQVPQQGSGSLHCAIYTLKFLLEHLCGRAPTLASGFRFNDEEAMRLRRAIALRLVGASLSRVDPQEAYSLAPGEFIKEIPQADHDSARAGSHARSGGLPTLSDCSSTSGARTGAGSRSEKNSEVRVYKPSTLTKASPRYATANDQGEVSGRSGRRVVRRKESRNISPSYMGST